MSQIVRTPKGTELQLLNLKGKSYLQVAHRILWFREEKPTWTIETSITSITEKLAVMKASIKDESGRLIATAHKSETPQGFADYLEKAETGAIGRALALCGYGTQFTDDLEEGARLADAPQASKVSQKNSAFIGPAHVNTMAPEPPVSGYVVGFGKWAGRTLEQVHADVGTDAIWDYIDYIKATAEKKNQPVTGMAADFVFHATEYLKGVAA